MGHAANGAAVRVSCIMWYMRIYHARFVSLAETPQQQPPAAVCVFIHMYIDYMALEAHQRRSLNQITNSAMYRGGEVRAPPARAITVCIATLVVFRAPLRALTVNPSTWMRLFHHSVAARKLSHANQIRFAHFLFMVPQYLRFSV